MEGRVCRICWNTSGWVRPTGEAANLESQNAYVPQHGYGQEEWLFRFDWLINGYKYGFLQPVGKFLGNYQGNYFSYLLWTFSENQEPLIVGKIREAYVPEYYELREAVDTMVNEGWLKEAHQDIYAVGGEPVYSENGDADPSVITNIRFKPEDVEIFDPMPLPTGDSTIWSNYYYHPLHPVDMDTSFSKDISRDYGSEEQGDEDKNEESGWVESRKGYSYDRYHNKLQNKISDYLNSLSAVTSVEKESKQGRNYVDLVCVKGIEKIFFEVKVANSVKRGLREAMGQVIEYANYPNEDLADSLVVVSDKYETEDDRNYLDYLRSKYNIPIYYQRFDWSEGALAAPV